MSHSGRSILRGAGDTLGQGLKRKTKSCQNAVKHREKAGVPVATFARRWKYWQTLHHRITLCERRDEQTKAHNKPPMQQIKFRGYRLHHRNREATESMIRQSEQFAAFFNPADDRPLIIDCGANIGVTVLDWKSRWPGARIVCFEPDPFAFELLQKNIDANDIPDVRCINAAVAGEEGTTTLFGDISRDGDARGNSIDPNWGDRGDSGQVVVACKRLSRFLTERVDFLKLDVEGVEQQVIDEITDQLRLVHAMYIEVHETQAGDNGEAAIRRQVETAGFKIESEPRYKPHALPEHLADWAESVGARQSQLLCWR